MAFIPKKAIGASTFASLLAEYMRFRARPPCQLFGVEH